MGNVVFHATTIVAVKRGDEVCIGGDGQVTMGESTIMKASAKKVRKIFKNTVVTGFAGSVADAVSLAQRWRSDKGMRNLEALMIVANKEEILVISGNGEVIVPDEDFVAIGSGGNYAYAAANALYHHTDLSAEEIVREALGIASSICVYTNSNISVEKL